MGCCSEYIEIGCFNYCDAISLGYNATQTGDHVIEVRISQDSIHVTTVSYTSGNDMTIPAGTLNETGPKDVRIKQPNGAYYEFDTDITCARLTTQVHIVT